jgi:hypothetical protein
VYNVFQYSLRNKHKREQYLSLCSEILFISFVRELGSAVSIVSDYRLDDWATGFFSSSLCVQAGTGANPASSSVGTSGPLLGAKARLGCDADHSPPSSAGVKNE